MNKDNIVELATVIQMAMKDYIENTPNCNYGGAISAGVKSAMEFGKGCYDPNFIEYLVILEKSVYNNNKFKDFIWLT